MRTISNTTLLGVVGTLTLCGCTQLAGVGGEGARTDKDRLQGTWAAASLETNGVQAPPEVVRQLTWKFTGDALVIKGALGDQREVPCTVYLEPGKSPKIMDYTPLGSPKPLRGIYELDGDRLKVCLVNGPGARPKEFATRAGTGWSLIVLTRSK